jgi:hypothetical protein
MADGGAPLENFNGEKILPKRLERSSLQMKRTAKHK